MEESVFNLNQDTLEVNDSSEGLELYRWNYQGEQPVYFLFGCPPEELHIITLDEGEPEFSQVRTRNESASARLITDEEVKACCASRPELFYPLQQAM